MVRGLVPDYCVIGHVACDLLAGSERRAGGTVTFAALAAARLGYQVGALTSAGLRQAGKVALGAVSAEPGVDLVCRPSEATTVFENEYSGNARRQYVRSIAAPIGYEDVPEGWINASVLHLGPIVHEIDHDQACLMFQAATGLRGLTPQGWLRRWDISGCVTPGPWIGMEALLPLADAVILSPEDVGEQRLLMEDLVRRGRVVVVTMADRGALIYVAGRETASPAFQAEVVDPTGAGDVFAAAFLLRMAETSDVKDAARYANCAASFVIEGTGASSLPSREQLEHRFRYGKLRH